MKTTKMLKFKYNLDLTTISIGNHQITRMSSGFKILTKL
jgi:hypothetical protein